MQPVSQNSAVTKPIPQTVKVSEYPPICGTIGDTTDAFPSRSSKVLSNFGKLRARNTFVRASKSAIFHSLAENAGLPQGYGSYMTNDTLNSVNGVLNSSQKEILADWIDQQLKDSNRSQAVPESSLRASSHEFLELFRNAIAAGNLTDLDTSEWEKALKMLSDLSASRAMQGSTPAETASFVFSLKEPLFERINKEFGVKDNKKLTDALSDIGKLIDKLGLYTFEAFQKTRESVIRRQQRDILEMSTPVIKVWDGVVAVPLIGTLDSARTQIVMENLLQAIVETGSKVAILDITGVPTVDTQTAQHLIKTVSATRLMGADCIISGIRPQIAQTIVHLGIDIFDISTKASMADAIKDAMERVGYVVKREFEKE